ncbi:hypothetical protein AVO44_17710 [Ruegeria profundi]|uniref:Uncharacterized protein n=1 Tax=Ruegeria profundi TaxID=1685378 RepID=A0A0X3TNE4_9RHOB|nr:hypothetical protein AVO44_17710 [Ruegeria profundi]
MAVAIDGTLPPRLSCRAGDAFLVQLRSNRLGRFTGCVVLEYAPDDARLVLVNCPMSAFLAMYYVVAKALAAAREAFLDFADKPAVRLLAKVGEEERVHRALETDVQFVDLTFCMGNKLYACKGKPLIDSGDVFLITADAIKSLSVDLIKATCCSVLHEHLNAWAHE